MQPSGPLHRQLIRDLNSSASACPRKREISGRALVALAEASIHPNPIIDAVVPARINYPKFKRLDRDPLTGLCLVPPIPMQHACNAAAAHSSSHPPYSTHLPHSHSWLATRLPPSSGASLPQPACAGQRSPGIPRRDLVRSAAGWADAEHVEPPLRSGAASTDWFRSRRAMRACPHFDTPLWARTRAALATPSWLRPERMARATIWDPVTPVSRGPPPPLQGPSAAPRGADNPDGGRVAGSRRAISPDIIRIGTGDDTSAGGGGDYCESWEAGPPPAGLEDHIALARQEYDAAALMLAAARRQCARARDRLDRLAPAAGTPPATRGSTRAGRWGSPCETPLGDGSDGSYIGGVVEAGCAGHGRRGAPSLRVSFPPELGVGRAATYPA